MYNGQSLCEITLADIDEVKAVVELGNGCPRCFKDGHAAVAYLQENGINPGYSLPDYATLYTTPTEIRRLWKEEITH